MLRVLLGTDFIRNMSNDLLSSSDVNKPRWEDSVMPFFVMVQENSVYSSSSADAIRLLDTTTNIGSEEASVTSLSESFSPGRFVSSQLYPDVQYIFEDD